MKINVIECVHLALLIDAKDVKEVLTGKRTEKQETALRTKILRLKEACNGDFELMLIKMLGKINFGLKFENNLIHFGAFQIDRYTLSIGEIFISELKPAVLCEVDRFRNFIEENQLEKNIDYKKESEEGSNWTPERPITLGFLDLR
jgi:hypothetical protein